MGSTSPGISLLAICSQKHDCVTKIKSQTVQPQVTQSRLCFKQSLQDAYEGAVARFR